MHDTVGVDLELIRSDLGKLEVALADLACGAGTLEALYKALETSAYRIAETIYAKQ